MASPECITLDSDSDSDVEFICDVKGEEKPKSFAIKTKTESKIPKREVDFIPIVDLDKEEEKRKVSGVFKRSGRKMVSDAVEIVSSISAVHEDKSTMKIEQVFSLKVHDNNGSTPQKRRRISTTVTPLHGPPLHSPPIYQRRQSINSTLPPKTSSQSPKKPNLPSATTPKLSCKQPTPKDDKKKKFSFVTAPSSEQKHSLGPKTKPSKPEPTSIKQKASSSCVAEEAIVLSDSDDKESEHDSESENSPNVKLAKELIKKLISVCLKSKLRDDLKKQIKEKLNRYMDAASPNVLKRNYFIRMVKEIIKDIEAILDCAEIYESHEVTLCDKIKSVVAELKKDSIIVNNKLIKLTNIYNKLKRRIQRLEETEVDTDDESINPYLLLDKYQKRATVVYNKMCEIQNIGNHADRPYLLPFSFKGKGPEPVERALEVYYNKTRKFPNFKEVLKLTKKVVEEKKLGLSEPEVYCTAQSVFTDFGRRLQMRRQRDDYHNLVGYINDGERDPAAEDPELNKKLEMNKHLYITKEQEVLDTYVKKQAMKDGKKKADDTEEESNCSNESSDGESENDAENSDSSSSSDEKLSKETSRVVSPNIIENSSEKLIESERKVENIISEENARLEAIDVNSHIKDVEDKSSEKVKESNEVPKQIILEEKAPEILCLPSPKKIQPGTEPLGEEPMNIENNKEKTKEQEPLGEEPLITNIEKTKES